jgi:ribose transport system permease protein
MSTSKASGTAPAASADALAAPIGDGGSGSGSRGLSVRRVAGSVLDMPSLSVIIALGLVLLLFAIAHPSFFSLFQIQNVLQSSVYVGVIACGMAFLIAMRQLDLSVSSILALTAGICALLINAHWNPWLAALAALVLAGVMGAINAFLVVTIGINALLATLATLYVYNGLQQGLSDSNNVNIGYNAITDQPIHGVTATTPFFTGLSGNFISIPIAAWIMLAFALLLTALLRFAPFGYRVRSIGSNPEAATFSGISIAKVTYQAFILVALASGLGGILVLLFFHTADPTVGGADNLLAIAAVIIGGTPMRGGSGSVIGAMLGSILLVGVIQSGLPYFHIGTAWTQFSLGVVILASVSVDSILRASRRRGAPR